MHLVKNVVILQLGSEPASVEPGVLNWLNFEVDVDLAVDCLKVNFVIAGSCSQCFYHLSQLEQLAFCLYFVFHFHSACPLFSFTLVIFSF